MSESIFDQPLCQLDLTESFKTMAHNHNFKTLTDILHVPVRVLLMHDGFSYHHYEELRKLLKEHEAIHLLKTEPS
ncbi:MAG TPA: hypothetical protein VFW07_15495 [Parafilimonas sp.]|nr:hypothetical protein [Parafilimonas sp.]